MKVEIHRDGFVVNYVDYGEFDEIYFNEFCYDDDDFGWKVLDVGDLSFCDVVDWIREEGELEI